METKYSHSIVNYVLPVSLVFVAVSPSPALSPVTLSPNADILIHTLFLGLKARHTNSGCI